MVRNDTFAVLRAGTDRRWGVGVVCGYGTNCSAVAPDGRITRFPAVGEISGRLGRRGRHRADGGLVRGPRRGRPRSPDTHLAELRARPLRYRHARGSSSRRSTSTGSTPAGSWSSRHSCSRAAVAGDAVARDIVDRQADEIVMMAGTAIKRLRMTKLDVHVVLGGGIFRTDDAAFFHRIQEGLRRRRPRGRIKVLTGAARDRRGASGSRPAGGGSRAAHERARRGLTHRTIEPEDSAPEGRSDHGQDRARRRHQGLRQRRDRRQRRLAGDRRRRVHGAGGPLRVREVHDPADRWPVSKRSRPARSTSATETGDGPSAQGPRHRDGVPELRPVSAYERGAEPRLRAEAPQDAEGRAHAPGRGRGEDPGPRTADEAQARRALRRPATARGDGPGDGARAASRS